ncbi:MAG: type II toxin-antitoxin system VapC family toxin [Leptospiraceae bacterium]|nr:type II toxin-antitoxin system VapC family toxin [Leptospiraceae bacterium]
MNHYLLDTNICIYLINNRPQEVYTKFKKVKLENIHISSVTDFELRYGVQKSSKNNYNSKILDEFLSYLDIIPFDSKAASIALCTLLLHTKTGLPLLEIRPCCNFYLYKNTRIVKLRESGVRYMRISYRNFNFQYSIKIYFSVIFLKKNYSEKKIMTLLQKNPKIGFCTISK